MFSWTVDIGRQDCQSVAAQDFSANGFVNITPAGMFVSASSADGTQYGAVTCINEGNKFAAIVTLTADGTSNQSAVSAMSQQLRDGMKPSPSTAWQPMDLVSRNLLDDNGLLLDPYWEAQEGGNTIPNPFALCGQLINGGITTCTSQPTTTDSVNFGSNPILDFLGCSSNGAPDHIDWFASTFRGWIQSATYGGSWPYDYDDSIFLVPATENLDTANGTISFFPLIAAANASPPPTIEVEFDSRETVNQFQTQFWKTFANNPSDPTLNLLQQPIIVTGLVGIDNAHGGRSELHPAFIVAIKEFASSTTDTWAIFARNWGDQGGCSSNEQQLLASPLLLRLPGRGPGSSVNSSEYDYGQGSQIDFSKNVYSGNDVVLTFDLPAPDQHGMVEAEVQIDWGASAPGKPASQGYSRSIAPMASLPVPSAPAEPPFSTQVSELDGPEERFSTFLQRMTSQQRAAFTAAAKQATIATGCVRPSAQVVHRVKTVGRLTTQPSPQPTTFNMSRAQPHGVATGCGGATLLQSRQLLIATLNTPVKTQFIDVPETSKDSGVIALVDHIGGLVVGDQFQPNAPISHQVFAQWAQALLAVDTLHLPAARADRVKPFLADLQKQSGNMTIGDATRFAGTAFPNQVQAVFATEGSVGFLIMANQSSPAASLSRLDALKLILNAALNW